MAVVFVETISRILRPRNSLLYLLGIAFVSLIAGFTMKYLEANSPILQVQQGVVFKYYLNFVYYWVLGLPLLIWISYFGTGLIAGERSRGTLLLLISKPLPRTSIFWGKYLALVSSTLLLGMSSLLLAITLISLSANIDSEIIAELLRTVLGFGLYLFFIAVCFSSLASGFSVICKTRKQGFVASLGLALIITLLFPVIRAWKPIFEVSQAISREGFPWTLNFVYPLAVMALCLLVCLGVMIFAMRRFEEMDIHSEL